MPLSTSIFRRRRRKPEAAIEPSETVIVADATVVVTTASRVPDVKQGEEKEAATTSVVVVVDRPRNRRAFVFLASVLVALAAFLLAQRQQLIGDISLDLLSKRNASLEMPSFLQQRRKVENVDDGADDTSTSSSTSSTSTSSSTSSTSTTAEDEEELADQARRAAESAAATSLGPSGFISREEWERALSLGATEGEGGRDDDDDDAPSSLASLEARIRARAGAAARGALLADAASLPWQGVSRRVVLETLKRCPEAVAEEPEFFEGGENEEEEEEDESASSSSSSASPPPTTKCPSASSLPRSYPGEITAGAFSALGYETLPLLQSLMASNGFNRRHFASASAMFFSRTPGHVNALPRRVTAAAAVAAAGGRGGPEGPEAAARAAAEDSSSSSAVAKVAPLVARFAGTPRLRGAVAGALAVHHRSASASAPAAAAARKGGGRAGGAAAARAAAGAAAAVLERVVVLGESVPQAVSSASELGSLSELARAYLLEVLEASEKGEASLSELLWRNAGKGDGGEQGVLLSSSEENERDESGSWDTAPAALKGALAASLLHSEDFASAVRTSMLAGGDATARAHLVGAFVGAATAEEAEVEKTKTSTLSSKPKTTKPPPVDWRPRVEKAVQADAMIHLILHQRGERVPVAMPGEQVAGAE